MIKTARFFTILFFLTSCSSLLRYQKSKEFKNFEFEKKVVIVETEEPKDTASTTPAVDLNMTNASGTTVATGSAVPLMAPKASPSEVPVSKTEKKAKLVSKKSKKSSSKAVDATMLKRQPDIEDSEGFVNNQRRPPEDPFRVGEVITHEVSYLGATAGLLTLRVNPFAVVNGKKSYNFVIELKSTSFFSKVFAVDDNVQTYVDYETLVPQVFKLDIRDSGQVKEAQSYFDLPNLKANYWEHRYTEKAGHEEKKTDWSILPFSQNPFSAIFYMRVFKLVDGREYAFRVADDEKNVLFKAKVLNREVLNTDAGEFKAVKMKAEVYSRGNLAKASDFYLWVSDDDRKYVLRIEVKLPFGSIVSEVSKIIPGKP